jgi:hypothetical protein
MKKLLTLAATAVAALAVTGAAQAGCMATVGLSPLPKTHQAGKPWLVTVRVLQHGRTPMPDARPVVRIRDAKGKLLSFRAARTKVVGSYRARVVFPRSGRYAISVYDGFPVAECARTHSFRPIVVVSV